MLTLTEAPIGTGRHRKCYLYPGDPAKCIKIVYNMGKGGREELDRELAYYRHLAGYLQDWTCIPRYWGTVETSQGTGYIYDNVRDWDGAPSATLAAVLAKPVDGKTAGELRAAFARLKKYLLDNRIVTMTIKPYNVLVQRVSPESINLVVCDNLSEASLIPMATWFGCFARSKLRRNWKRFASLPEIAPYIE